MADVQETKVRSADSKTRAFFARILSPFSRFRRFAGIPLDRARAIMGLQIHDIGAVRLYLNHDTLFADTEHLQRVPYTERELFWAVKNGFVLTIVSASMRRIARVAGSEVLISREIMATPHIVAQHPRHAQWRLVSRSPQRAIETKSLGLSKQEEKRRLGLAPAALALTAAYLDYAIYRLVPRGLYLTATSLEEGGDFSRRILVGGSMRHDLRSTIHVVAGREAGHLPVLTLKPHKIMLS